MNTISSISNFKQRSTNRQSELVWDFQNFVGPGLELGLQIFPGPIDGSLTLQSHWNAFGMLMQSAFSWQLWVIRLHSSLSVQDVPSPMYSSNPWSHLHAKVPGKLMHVWSQLWVLSRHSSSSRQRKPPEIKFNFWTVRGTDLWYGPASMVKFILHLQ